jgi:hypothetical protein
VVAKPAFVAATLSPGVVRAVEQIVRARPEVTEAHLVAMRADRPGSNALALILLTEATAVIYDLERELRCVLKPHVRPKILHFPGNHTELPWVRGLGGELKRETGRFPWWLFLLGI